MNDVHGIRVAGGTFPPRSGTPSCPRWRATSPPWTSARPTSRVDTPVTTYTRSNYRSQLHDRADRPSEQHHHRETIGADLLHPATHRDHTAGDDADLAARHTQHGTTRHHPPAHHPAASELNHPSEPAVHPDAHHRSPAQRLAIHSGARSTRSRDRLPASRAGAAIATGAPSRGSVALCAKAAYLVNQFTTRGRHAGRCRGG